MGLLNKKGKKMKNIMKIVIALFTSASLMASASAGELTVTGSAKARNRNYIKKTPRQIR